MRTKLELVGSGFLDMFDDVSISLNYSIADIAEPDKRQASYSKTISLPGTANNNKLNHATPTMSKLVFQRPCRCNSEINLMP